MPEGPIGNEDEKGSAVGFGPNGGGEDEGAAVSRLFRMVLPPILSLP